MPPADSEQARAAYKEMASKLAFNPRGGMPAEWILALVEEGVIEPVGADQSHWHFRGHCLRRVRIVQRLQSDLGINLAGAALALELLEEVEALRSRIAVLEK